MGAASALVLIALVLAWPVPRIMAGQLAFRRLPRPALVLWQAVSLAAVLAALLAAPVGLWFIAHTGSPQESHLTAVVVALAVSGSVLALLLRSGHRVGRRLRTVRREHRTLVDVLATHDGSQLRVLEHPTPTAYCLPGLRRRVVLTRGALDRLTREELAAVLAHERAHLRARHDLVLEFFTVVHESVPPPVRCPAALAEVRLLVEVLADRAAVRAAGELATARALVALAETAHPEATLGAGPGPAASTAQLRLELLGAARERRLWQAVTMYAVAAAVVATPLAVAAAGVG